MNDSTRRAIRTLVHGALAAAAVIPVAVAALHLPAGRLTQAAAALVLAAGAVSRVWNALEDAGAVPSWLKR